MVDGPKSTVACALLLFFQVKAYFQNQMKRILAHLTFLSATILSAFVAKADSEITEGPTGLTTTTPGVTITGSQDNWTITAPAGSLFRFEFKAIQVGLLEPQSESGHPYNLLTASDADVFPSFTWQSDLTAEEFLQQTGGGIDTYPSGSDALELVTPHGDILDSITLNDTGDAPVGAPDTSPTLLLLGLGFLGMGLLARLSALPQGISSVAAIRRCFFVA
jgi:hypothetical protein